MASDNFGEVFLNYLKEHCADAFSRFYREDGSLRDAFKSADDIAAEYNKDVAFTRSPCWIKRTSSTTTSGARPLPTTTGRSGAAGRTTSDKTRRKEDSGEFGHFSLSKEGQ